MLRSERDKLNNVAQLEQKETSQGILKVILNQLKTPDTIDWDRIADKVNVSVLQVLQSVREDESLYHQLSIIFNSPQTWSQQQLGKLQSFIIENFNDSIDWTLVSLYMSIKETDCASEYYKTRHIASGVQLQLKWTPEDDDRLKAAVAKFPQGTDISWVQVAKEVGNRRSAENCANRIVSIRQIESKECAVWAKEEFYTIEQAISNSAKGERVVEGLCQLIPSKSRIQIHAQVERIRKRGYYRNNSHFNQEDKQLLVSLVDEQMTSMLLTYSTMSEAEKIKYVSGHCHQIDWKRVGKQIDKQPAMCREKYESILWYIVTLGE